MAVPQNQDRDANGVASPAAGPGDSGAPGRKALPIEDVVAGIASGDPVSNTVEEVSPLQAREFELRRNLTTYDVMYVALAEVLRSLLLTDDCKFASAPGHRAELHHCPD
jgi:hypothetical protein